MTEEKGNARNGKLVLLIGPSGVGKSVILKALKKRNPDLHFPRSATTRPRRPGEGEELYEFVTDDIFDRSLRDGKLLEWARVHEGARYGTLLSEIIPAIEEGKIVVREVDVQGFESIRANALFAGPQALYRLQSIFILPESKEQLIARIRKRAPINEEELQKRIASMERELAYAPLCEQIIVNREGKIAEAVEGMEKIIVGAGQ
ncbi:MAG: guanylate kinase [Patescibacteria group bacterium]